MTFLQKFLHKHITQYHLIFLVALFFALFGNTTFFYNVIDVYPLSFTNFFYILSLFFILISVITLLFTLFSSKYTTKPLLIIALLVSSFTSYFMGTYHVVIDAGMIQNSLQTDLNESMDLFSFKLILYVLFLGILPSIYVYKKPIKYLSNRKELWMKIKIILISLGVIGFFLLSFSQFYTSFFREHKPLRYHTNPMYWIYSIGKYAKQTVKSGPVIVEAIGNDAHISTAEEDEEKELVILVVGEAARADRFSLNGYERETNPLLKQEKNLINFSNVSSCGTSTAVSVPCMFSMFGKEKYNYDKGISTENVLDVLVHTNEIKVLWRDNNSDSKGVALRVYYENFRTTDKNPVYDEACHECRDEGMLAGLDAYIKHNKGKDILIVLHMMGNHGPAYYKRYPKEFEKFTPVCKTNQLEECSPESISNAYDNAILYTDYFLSKVIHFLKHYSKDHATAMLYISDHGESLGENSLYLHGLPYFMAPDAQTHVAAMAWLEGVIEKDIDVKKLRSISDKPFSQDNLFHTLLGIFEVETELYDPKMDILHDVIIPE
jgi:lipid A ethanolaminephosphotransferase